MKILRANVLGFCMGVRRAVTAAENALKKNGKDSSNVTVYTLGPLIHNTFVQKSLSDRGVKILDDVAVEKIHNGFSIKGAAVVIRAHGVPPATRSVIENAGADIIDATCPRVIANQKKAAAYSATGYTVFIAGDPEHSEVISIAGFAESCIVVPSATAAEQIGPVVGKAVLISQTTIKQDEYDSIATVLKAKMPDIEVLDTICPATAERQQSLRDLCAKVDGIVVVGSADSANTVRLYTLACQLGKKAWLIESPDTIPEDVFMHNSIGITAGASAPESVIAAIEKALKKE